MTIEMFFHFKVFSSIASIGSEIFQKRAIQLQCILQTGLSEAITIRMLSEEGPKKMHIIL